MSTALRVESNTSFMHHTPRAPPPAMPMHSDTFPANFYTSGTSNEQLTVYLAPHQTLYTHNNCVVYLSPHLTVEHLPRLQLPVSYNGSLTCLDHCLKCISQCFASLCKCSFFDALSSSSGSPSGAHYSNNSRLVLNNNRIEQSLTATPPHTQMEYVCLSPSLQISSPHSYGSRNYVSAMADTSGIPLALSRKILSINLSSQHKSSLVINIVNLFAYLISDRRIYDTFDRAQNLSDDQLLMDFTSPIRAYDLAVSSTYSNEHNARLVSSLERFLTTMNLTRERTRNNNAPPNNAPVTNTIGDLVSRRTSARESYRKRYKQAVAKERRHASYCCVEVVRYSCLFASLTLFPAVILLLMMNQVLEQMTSDNCLPLSRTLCLVQLQCPQHNAKMRKKNQLGAGDADRELDSTIVFLESNGDIYHKLLGKNEKFYIRGECVIAFDKMLRSTTMCNYGQSGAQLGDYRCKGDFIEFVGPGNVWYGNGKQDLMSNAYKLQSLLFCDNLRYSDEAAAAWENSSGNTSGRHGNYSNGRFGVIQSFELRSKYKIKFMEKCLIVSTVVLVLSSILLFTLAAYVEYEPISLGAIYEEIDRFFQQFDLRLN